MTNHNPLESETFIKRIGRKKKEFKIVSWKDEYERRKRIEKKKEIIISLDGKERKGMSSMAMQIGKYLKKRK